MSCQLFRQSEFNADCADGIAVDADSLRGTVREARCCGPEEAGPKKDEIGER